MKAADVAEFCRHLQELGIPIWLDGGWGVDALLGEQTRPHDDLDIVVEERNLLRLRGLLEAEGFKDVPRADTRPWNFVLGHDDGRLVDFHVVAFDAIGNGICGPPGTGQYPAAAFEGIGSVNGLSVRCLTADYQISRTGYEPRDKDLRDVRALCARFDLPLPVNFNS